MKTVNFERNVNLANVQNVKTRQITNIFGARKRLRYAGFNAIELSLVLGVIAVAIVGVVRIMGGNTDKQNSIQMVNDVSDLAFNIKNAYSGATAGYKSLTNAEAITGRLVPQDLKSAVDKIQNQFQGGSIVLKGDDGGDTFIINYTKVPSSVCNTAITALAGSTFLQIDVGGDTTGSGTTVYKNDGTVKLDATALFGACDKGPIDITFTVS